MNDNATLAPGTQLQNRYVITRSLGRGGMGAVYEAGDQRLNIRCAIKETFYTDRAALAQFEREARLLASLKHNHLPRVTDYFAERGRYYLVMDYVPGLNAIEWIQQRGRPSETLVIQWGRQMLHALDYLHHRQPPIIHRDVKPANVKLTPEGEAVLVDFGIAKLFDPQGMTTMGAKAISPGYSPPEQYSSTARTDARSDVYGLGGTLYYLLAGQAPPEATDRLMGHTLPPPSRFGPVSPDLEAVVMRALALDMAQRWPSAGAMRDALGRVNTHAHQGGTGQRPAAAPVSAPSTSRRASSTSRPVPQPRPQATTADKSRSQRTNANRVSTNRRASSTSRPAPQPQAPTADKSRSQRTNTNRTQIIALGVVGALIIVALLVFLILSLTGGRGGQAQAEPTPTVQNVIETATLRPDKATATRAVAATSTLPPPRPTSPPGDPTSTLAGGPASDTPQPTASNQDNTPTPKPPSGCTSALPQLVAPAPESSHYAGVSVRFAWQGGSLCPGQTWYVVFSTNPANANCGTTANEVMCQVPTEVGEQHTWWVEIRQGGQVVPGMMTERRGIYSIAPPSGGDGGDGGNGGDETPPPSEPTNPPPE